MSHAPIQYVKGDWKAVCDSCGRRFLASSLKKRWDGLMTCPDDYEQRNPQDFVRAKQDIQAVPWSRPEGQDSFLYPGLTGTPGTVPSGTFTP